MPHGGGGMHGWVQNSQPAGQLHSLSVGYENEIFNIVHCFQ